MAFKKKALSLLLAVCMVASMLGTTAFAAGSNVTVEIGDNKTTAMIGDTITVTVSNNAMTVSSIGTSIVFDKDLLTCTAIAGCYPGYPNQYGLFKTGGGPFAWTAATAVSTVAEANENGTVGFTIAGTSDASYDAGVVFTATFTVKAAGTANIVLTEESDGANGFSSTNVATKTITLSAPVVDVTGVTLDQTSLNLTAGSNATLVATVKPDDATDKTVTWDSSDENVATVAGGTVTAVAPGTATIIAKAGDKTATCVVTVTCAHTGGTATCAAKAVCTVCGKEYGEKNPANHVVADPVIKGAVTESCKDDGYTGDKHCAGCDALLEKGTVITATGEHKDADGKWESDGTNHWHTCTCGTKFDTTACSGGTATCAAKAVCSTCGNEYGAKNPANHVVADPVIKGAVTESCKDDGYTGDKHCAGCDALLEKGTVITATGEHKDADSKWESDGTNHWHTCACGTEFEKAACSGGTATCAAKAVCSTCGNEYGEKNPANHVVAEPVIKGAVTESCKDDGYTGDKHCAGCDALLEKGTVITATGEHKDADGKWESDGTNHWHTCACGTKIDVTAHTLKEVADAAYLKSEANCSNAAVYYMSCEICGAKGADTYTFESGEKVATAHKWNDRGICEHNDKHTKFEKEPGEKVEDVIEGLVSGDITVKELVEGVLKTVENLNTLFKDGSVEVVEGKLVYELLPDAPEGEYYIEITVGDVVYVVNVVVAEESVIVDRPDRPSYNSSAVKKVIEMIDELPSAKKVTLDDEEDIEAARKAYEKLSKADKAKVTNYEDLVEVEEALEALKNAAPEVIDNPFVDVDDDAYYADAVLWAVENAITSGTSTVTFSPDAVCTRAQVVTFLWRAAGCPAPLTSEMPFVDVEAGAYYAAAVQWAVENNITAGTSATTFDPNGKCTRGQIVTFLWRAQGNPAAAAVNNFVDVEDGAYYNAPVLWAVANGITNGTSTTTFSPAADCTRAQVVTFIYRCMAE